MSTLQARFKVRHYVVAVLGDCCLYNRDYDSSLNLIVFILSLVLPRCPRQIYLP